jgi:hypothetical protein
MTNSGDTTPDNTIPANTPPVDRDPSAAYPPSRPTWRMLFIALAIAAVAVLLLNWPQVSSFAHLAQIQSQIEHAVGR